MANRNAETADDRLLDPAQLRLLRAPDGTLRLIIEGERCVLRVRPARAFPISDADHYIGLADGAGADIGLLHTPAALDPDSRAELEKELLKRYFCPVIQRVLSVRSEFGLLSFRAHTDKGYHEFVVRDPRENILELGPGRLLIIDAEGNRFEVPDLRSLDARTRAALERVL